MSRLLYVCLSNSSSQQIEELVHRCKLGASRISPKNTNVRSTEIVSGSRAFVAVVNPPTAHSITLDAVHLGHIADSPSWDKVGDEAPEGTYVICRSNGDMLQVVSDAVGSRTLWYYMDASIFVASTSQRWIASILGSFEPNENVLTWMLTTGTLGPGEAWDRRLLRLQPDSILTVDLRAWTTVLTSRGIEFRPDELSKSRLKQVFSSELCSAFEQLEYDFSKWVLPLSGGYDSRGILCLLRHAEGLRTVTWGTKASMREDGSDAAIASKLASSLGLSHEYFSTDIPEGSLEMVFDKFIAFGEGRIDNVSGYLDSFAIWHTLLDRGIEGIIRGDEGFGWRRVSSASEARQSVGLLLWSDYRLPLESEAFELKPQEIPGSLLRRDNEEPARWRDRLYQQYRAPTILAALTDLKAAFVEISNPLLSHRVIYAVRKLPDHLRTEKKLFKELVNEMSPRVPYASMRSIVGRKEIFHSEEAASLLAEYVSSEAARAVFSKPLLNYILQGMRGRSPKEPKKPVVTRMKRRLQRMFPEGMEPAFANANQKHIIDFHEWAFRVYVVCKSHDYLHADAGAAFASHQPRDKQQR